MEVFTVSVGIGRVAISVCQTRQVVSRLHDRLYTTTFGSQPLIVSVLRHQGLRRCVAVLGICSPAARLFTGPSYLSLPVPIHPKSPPPFRRRTPPGSSQAAFPRIRGCYLSLSGSSGGSFLSSPNALRPHPFSAVCANLAPPLPDGRTPTIPAPYLSIVAWPNLAAGRRMVR